MQSQDWNTLISPAILYLIFPPLTDISFMKFIDLVRFFHVYITVHTTAPATRRNKTQENTILNIQHYTLFRTVSMARSAETSTFLPSTFMHQAAATPADWL